MDFLKTAINHKKFWALWKFYCSQLAIERCMFTIHDMCIAQDTDQRSGRKLEFC